MNIPFVAIGFAATALVWGQASVTHPPAAGYTQRDLETQDAYQGGLALLGQVKADLDRTANDPAPNPGDHYRFATARGELDRLQRTWHDGSYTRTQLNDAISHIQLVLNFNHLSPGGRALLSADLERLRDFRVEHFY